MHHRKISLTGFSKHKMMSQKLPPPPQKKKAILLTKITNNEDLLSSASDNMLSEDVINLFISKFDESHFEDF